MRPALVLALAMLLAGCGGSSSTNSTSATTSNSESFSTFASAHFNFRYTSLDASSIATTAARVEAVRLEDTPCQCIVPRHFSEAEESTHMM
jgi:ABC-type glycerol-3-phosphate transport system substrate-binding protein